METLRNLPDISGRKFGTLQIGYDRIDQIRTEVSVLEALAALVCGCTREELTLHKVQAATAELTGLTQERSLMEVLTALKTPENTVEIKP